MTRPLASVGAEGSTGEVDSGNPSDSDATGEFSDSQTDPIGSDSIRPDLIDQTPHL
jgi:hypothetical protein